MNLIIDEIEKLSPEYLVELFQHFNWKQYSARPGYYEAWRDEKENESFEILIPLMQDAEDYPYMAQRALKALISRYGHAAVEAATLLAKKHEKSLETSTWSQATEDSGLIPWRTGEELFRTARLQFAAAAKSTQQASRNHRSTKPYIATDFLSKTMMGQTGAGSFIISAYTEADAKIFSSNFAKEDSALIAKEGTMFRGSDILDTYENALEATRVGLSEYRKSPRIEVFLEKVASGLSSELLMALSLMVDGGQTHIQMQRRRTNAQKFVTKEQVFEKSEGPTLESVASKLALNPDPITVELIGEVVMLKRSATTTDKIQEIQLIVSEGADIRSAKIELRDEDYVAAQRAHHQETNMTIRGTLVKEGRSWRLQNAAGAEVLDQPVDS
jgi:hypothetical protein